MLRAKAFVMCINRNGLDHERYIERKRDGERESRNDLLGCNVKNKSVESVNRV